MELKGLTGGLYQPLSSADVETIHQAALAILEKTGISYESGLEDTIDMLEAQGAKVDRARARVFFAGDMVVTHAAKAPERVILFSRDGKNDLDLAQHRVYLGTGGAAIKILDIETGKVLKGIEVDPEHLALEVIDEVGPGGNFIASDHTFAHMRTEYFAGNGVADRKIRDYWEQDGSRDAATRARKIAKTILAQEEKSYIPAEVARAIRKKYNIIGDA